MHKFQPNYAPLLLWFDLQICQITEKICQTTRDIIYSRCAKLSIMEGTPTYNEPMLLQKLFFLINSYSTDVRDCGNKPTTSEGENLRISLVYTAINHL